MGRDKSSQNSQILGLFHKSVRSILKRRGMTQNALAKAMGENYKTVNNWLTGGATPTVISAAKMADCLAVSLDKLVGRVPPGAEALEHLRQQTSSIGAALNEILPDSSVGGAHEPGAPTPAPTPIKKTKAKTKKKQPKRKAAKP